MATEKWLIDANKFKHKMKLEFLDRRNKFISMNDLFECIDDMPTVDAVEVVHGEWIEDYETFVQDNGYESEPIQTGYICSECCKDGFPIWHYCPNCGAKMYGDVNG